MSVSDPNQFRGPVNHRVPEGDSLPRLVCDDCGFVQYVNPKIVVGSVVLWGDRFLMCKRAIEPRKGYWTLPAGFMEEKETIRAAACREAMEEACAEIEIRHLLAIYDIPHISQVQVMFVAHLVHDDIKPGPESAEVGLFLWDEIPWKELAFPSVLWALRHYQEVKDLAEFAPRGNPEAARQP